MQHANAVKPAGELATAWFIG